MKRCASSGKRKYHTKVDAVVAFSNMPHMVRFYKCPDCGFWHASKKASHISRLARISEGVR